MNTETKIRFARTKAWIAAHPIETAVIASVTIGTALKVAETRSSIRSKNAYARQINAKYSA